VTFYKPSLSCFLNGILHGLFNPPPVQSFFAENPLRAAVQVHTGAMPEYYNYSVNEMPEFCRRLLRSADTNSPVVRRSEGPFGSLIVLDLQGDNEF
jgi:hypothetical protein